MLPALMTEALCGRENRLRPQPCTGTWGVMVLQCERLLFGSIPSAEKKPPNQSSCKSKHHSHFCRQLDLWKFQATLCRQPCLSTRTVHFCCLRNIEQYVWSSPVNSLYRSGSAILFSCPTEVFQQVPAIGSCRYRHILAFFTWMVPVQLQIILHCPEAYLPKISRTPASIPILLSIIICSSCHLAVPFGK